MRRKPIETLRTAALCVVAGHAIGAGGGVEMTISQSAQLIDTYWLGQVGGIGLAAAAIGSTLRMVLISP